MVYWTLKISRKLQWLILLYFYNRKNKHKSENIPLKLQNPFREGLYFSLHAAPFYTTLAVKKDFQLVFCGIYARFKAFCISRGE